MENRSLTNLNGHLMAAVDVETTGFEAGYHEIIQVAVLPLDSNCRPLKSVMPFYMTIKPDHPSRMDKEAAGVHGISMSELILKSLDKYKVADLLVEWFYKIGLPDRKKLVPLACNWFFDRSFIVDWLGPKTFDLVFDYHARDIMLAALYLNDRAEFHVEKIPFPKVSLRYICNILGVHNEHAHDALQDCVATAECYRRLCLVPTC